MKSVVVTGASTGIGNAIAKKLVYEGFQVFGSVRSQNDANRLSKDFGSNFTPLIFDIVDEEAVKKGANFVREKLQGNTLYGLVNNAGINVTCPLLHVPLKDFREQIETNLTGSLIVVQAFVPLLGADRSLKGDPGRLVIISSAFGKISLPLEGPYNITKHGTEAFADTLRRELMLYGIAVSTIRPGPIDTPIIDKGTKFYDLVQKTDYAEAGRIFLEEVKKTWKTALHPSKVADVVYKALTSARPKIVYVITADKFKNWYLPRYLPSRWFDKAISYKFKLAKK